MECRSASGLFTYVCPYALDHRLTLEQAIDVGEALEKLLRDDTTASETFELFGPNNYSLAEIARLVDREIIKKRRHINLPKALFKPAAEVLNRALWWHTTSGDEVEREFIDQVIDPTAKTFKDLDIEPSDLKDWTFQYLVSCVGLSAESSANSL
jgi:NADH dehydrogenase (ubiquinone) 1 alpha subcomplex subunit 9